MEQAIRTRVYKTIKSTLGIDPEAIDPDAEIESQVTLDSMQYVNLTARIEMELDIELPLSIMESKTLNEFLKSIDHEIGQPEPRGPMGKE